MFSQPLFAHTAGQSLAFCPLFPQPEVFLLPRVSPNSEGLGLKATVSEPQGGLPPRFSPQTQAQTARQGKEGRVARLVPLRWLAS